MIQSTIQLSNDTDARGYPVLYVGKTRVLVGDHIATYDDDAGDTGYPCTLADGVSTIEDDRDRDDLNAILARLGLDTETDDEGLVLAMR